MNRVIYFPAILLAVIIFLISNVNIFAQSTPKTWYFSSSMGNDNNSGLSPTQPLKSVDKFRSLLNGVSHQGQSLQRGDTIAFLKGDTFRIVNFGTTGSDKWRVNFNTNLLKSSGPVITIKSYGSGNNRPVFVPTWNLASLSGTVVSSGPIVKIYRPLTPMDSFVVFRLFYKGKPMILAREPDTSSNVLNSMWLIDSAKQVGSNTLVYSSAVSSMNNGFFVGATFWGSSSGYSWRCTKPVISKSGNVITLPSTGGVDTYLRGNRFYVENKREYLDSAGEWYYDAQSDTLYIYPVSLPFVPSDYEVLAAYYYPNQNKSPFLPYGFTLTSNYDTMPNNPIQNIHIRDIGFSYFPTEAIRMAGVKDIRVENCLFYECGRCVWNFLGRDLKISKNIFRHSGFAGVVNYGRTPSNVVPGNPKCLTRRVWIEENEIKYTGLRPRWSWQTLVDANTTFVLEDYSITSGYGTDSVFIRKNRIDSVSQGGIMGTLYYYTQTSWYQNYPGTLPYVIEKNYITNFCMDFSDCGGIKVYAFNKNGIIRNNILDKGNNRDKRYLADYRFSYRYDGGAGKGLYSDVHQEGIHFVGNTVIETDLGIANYGGGWDMDNIRMDSNTIYNPVVKGIDATAGISYKITNFKARKNLLFGSKSGRGLVHMYDADNTSADSLQELNDNRYFNPNNMGLYYRRKYGKVESYGYNGIKQNTNYEQGANSYWGWWAEYKWNWWANAIVTNTLTSNPNLTPPVSNLPFQTFGSAQMASVSTSPIGNAIMITCPTTATNASGIRLKTSEALYTSTLSPMGVYRFRMIYAANKKKDFRMDVPMKTNHPVTGDVIGSADYFSLPVRSPYVGDSIALRYEPRLYQTQNRPEIRVEPGDTLWIKYFEWEEIDKNSVPSLKWYYPIYYNASDNVQIFSLPSGQVYLTTDSTLVSGSISVQPWSSRILIWLGMTTGIDEGEHKGYIDEKVIGFPNPVREDLCVISSEKSDYELYTLEGRLLRKGKFRGGEVERVSMKDLSTGLYILKVRGDYWERSLKIVKE
jgi:hypothetical protein